MEYSDKMILEVCKFLRKHKALERFCYNKMTYHGIKVSNRLSLSERVWKIMLVHVNYQEEDLWFWEDYISSCSTSFYWEATPEGTRFWEDLNDKWHNEYYKLNNKMESYDLQ